MVLEETLTYAFPTPTLALTKVATEADMREREALPKGQINVME